MASQSTFDIPLDSLPPSYRTTERNADFDPIRRAETGTPEPQDTSVQEPVRHEFSQLPPVDGGKDAWLFLAACFVVEALVWGFPYSFGVFQDYYSIHPPFSSSSNLAVIGTCAMGIMYIDTPLIMSFFRRFPRFARWAPIVGLLVMCFALAMSSFSTTVTHLIVTQGILYGIGGSIAYSPCILYLDEWFVKKKGLAYGIMWSGTGLAGVVLPPLLEHLLSEYGYQTTLRIWAVAVFVLTAPLAWFLKPRISVGGKFAASEAVSNSSTSGTTTPTSNNNNNNNNNNNTNVHAAPPTPYTPSFSFVLTRPFLFYQLFNIIEALGFFLPGIYLPSYARSVLQAQGFLTSLTLLLLNVASVFGCVAMGWFIDRLDVTTCIMLSTAGTVLGTFFLWGFGTNLAVLYVFCVVYGFFAGSFTSAWPGIMKEVAKLGHSGSAETENEHGSKPVDPTMVFAFLALGRGVGNVVSGPLSETLVKELPWQGQALAGYGSGYGGLIAFTGVTALVGGGSFLWKRLGWL
ncbi:major facilitator superfamily domain-containing protein [Neurospora hispaniola]|uniref:Major facilitator superfamily domain-containing protein n=1 Tax=Neurospora hispaniola TaxID=588809 RepID=A0AAJ0IAE1_9PEZI|nr:major facilitator superfamily domain-containing protein [Neurospora hispaniola]